MTLSESDKLERNASEKLSLKRRHIAGNCYDFLDDQTGLRLNLSALPSRLPAPPSLRLPTCSARLPTSASLPLL